MPKSFPTLNSFFYFLLSSSALTKLAKSSNKDLRGASASALWEIQGGTLVPASPSPSTAVDSLTDTPPSPPSYQETMRNTQVVSQHTKIMLSYQWGSQQMVLKIKHRLEKAGFRVWMDVSNISKGSFDR